MSDSLSQFKSPLRLVGQPQSYSWGKVGKASRIAPFLEGEVAEGPLAEYWLGCHPKAPARVILPEGARLSINDILSPSSALPFMLKVLSINPQFGLSIQSHPDTVRARELHARDPKNYPDPFHKPEVGVALSDVKLVYDIKSPENLRDLIHSYPELAELLSRDTKGLLDLKSWNGEETSTALRRGFFVDFISAEPTRIVEVISRILGRFDAGYEPESPEEISIIRRLSSTYGCGDPGLPALLVMNLVTLKPGDALFIGPNVPHAYLDGDLVECMACSDNVIRAGLTTKYRDVATLVSTIDFAFKGEPRFVETREMLNGFTEFSLPVNEFSLSAIRPGFKGVSLETRFGHSVIFCVGGRAELHDRGSSAKTTLVDGSAILVPEGYANLEISTEAAQVFVAQARGARI
jgi:mannose-6-phosphate isomerase